MVDVTAVDLFCGAGGLSYGLEATGISVSAGIDIDHACEYPYEANTDGEFLQRDLSVVLNDSEERNRLLNEIRTLYPDEGLRILAGCAPCQPYSHLSNSSETRQKDHDGWGLLEAFREVVSEVDPDIVVMENVPQLRGYDIYDEFRSYFEPNLDAWAETHTTRPESGYHVWDGVVNTVEYGVPQSRKRLLLLASKHGPIDPISPTNSPDTPVTVRRHLTTKSLADIGPGEQSDIDPLHRAAGLSSKNVERLKQSAPGGSWEDWDDDLKAKCHQRASGRKYVSSYGRMEWDEPAPTITTQFYNYGSGRFGHPDYDTENPDLATNRAISLREGALIQTFPRWYKFEEEPGELSNDKLGQLIGNAVPVRLAKVIGGTIQNHLQQTFGSRSENQQLTEVTSQEIDVELKSIPTDIIAPPS